MSASQRPQHERLTAPTPVVEFCVLGGFSRNRIEMATETVELLWFWEVKFVVVVAVAP